MKARYHMHSLRHGIMVEHYYRETLAAIRKADARFKYQRIQHVIQACPSRIRVGVVYDLA